MFTRHEIFKHIINPDESDSDQSSSDDEDFFLEMNAIYGTEAKEEEKEKGETKEKNKRTNSNKVKNMNITLHLIDRSFIPNSSSLTRLEPIDATPLERIFPISIGDGSQTFRWLALTAKQRLHHRFHREGLIRQRENVLGQMGSFLPTSITSEDPETDGEFLKPDMILNTVVEHGDHLWLNFNQKGGSQITNWEREAFFVGGTQFKDKHAARTNTMDNVERRSDLHRPLMKTDVPSIFYSRKFESDSRDYYDSTKLLNRAFLSDWKRWKNKPQFFDTIDAAMKKNLYRHYNNLRAVFRFYASSGAGDPFTMSMNEFITMTRSCQIPQHSLGVLWKLSNFNPEDSKKSDHVLERHEFLEIIMRLAHEVFITRTQLKDVTRLGEEGDVGDVGVAGEGGGGKEGGGKEEEKEENAQPVEVEEELMNMDAIGGEGVDNGSIDGAVVHTAASAVDQLMDVHINSFLWVDVAHASTMYADPDAFRRERLYFEEVNHAFLQHVDDLLVLYEAYAQKSALRLREFNSTYKLLCYLEFEDIIQIAGLVGLGGEGSTGSKGGKGGKGSKGSKGSKGKAKGRGGTLSTLDIRRSFVFAQMTCANDLSRSRRERSHDSQNRATFIEFCEALARLCDLNQMKNNPAKTLERLSTSLEPFLKRLIDGMGSGGFWKTHRNTGHYNRTVTKKYGSTGTGNKTYGPEVGRFELDKSSEAVAHRQLHRKHAATKLPKNLEYLIFEEVKAEVEPVEDSKKSKSKRK